MNGWLAFWKWLCIINVAVYYLLMIVLVPMAIRDMIALVRELNIKHQENPVEAEQNGG